MSTPDTTSFFSPENRLMVFFITLSIIMNIVLLKAQYEMKSDLRIITYRLNNGTKTKQEKLAKAYVYRRKGKPKLQTSSPLLAIIRRTPMYCYESRY